VVGYKPYQPPRGPNSIIVYVNLGRSEVNSKVLIVAILSIVNDHSESNLLSIQ